MTCIVGMVDNEKVYMGGDSAGVADLDIVTRKDVKVFKKDDFIIGFTTSFRMGQLLRFKLNVPKRHQDTDVYEYMVTDFIDAVRTCLKNGGYAQQHSGEESGGTFLAGYAGRLFEICGDYQVGECSLPYQAVGCGWSYAKGCLFGLPSTMSPENKIKKALGAASEFSAGVRGPFVIESI